MKTWPPEFCAQMQALLGAETADFFQAEQSEAPVSLRLNPRKLRLSQGTLRRSVPWCSQGLYLTTRPVFTLDPRFHAGGYYVQDASCMLLEALLQQLPGRHPGMRVLDLCAAPGGKTTHLLQLLPEQSVLIANELIPTRAQILEENLLKWGAEQTLLTQHAAQDFQALPFQMDLILVDAPCSGEGLFRRQPETLQEWSPAQVQFCAGRQAQILQSIWPVLKPGCCLIYSTCTWNRQENEALIADFAARQACELLPLDFPAAWGIVQSDEMPLYRCFPHRLPGEGFSFCVLRKLEASQPEKARQIQKVLRYKSQHSTPEAPPKALAEWLQGANPADLWRAGKTVWYWPAQEREYLQQVSAVLKRVRPGLPLAELRGKTWNPSAALALNPRLQSELFPSLSLSLTEALAYLSRETLAHTGQGWHLLRTEGLALGWVKATPSHSNNAWPKAWKIRQRFEKLDPFANRADFPALEAIQL